MKKTKIITSLIAIACIVFMFGTLVVNAAEDGKNTTITTITPSGTKPAPKPAEKPEEKPADKPAENTEAGAITPIKPGKPAEKPTPVKPNTNTNSNSNINKNVNANKNANTNKSSYNDSTSKDKIPYTGSNNKIIFVGMVALGVSAVYAYKKISDYNA